MQEGENVSELLSQIWKSKTGGERERRVGLGIKDKSQTMDLLGFYQILIETMELLGFYQF